MTASGTMPFRRHKKRFEKAICYYRIDQPGQRGDESSQGEDMMPFINQAVDVMAFLHHPDWDTVYQLGDSIVYVPSRVVRARPLRMRYIVHKMRRR